MNPDFIPWIILFLPLLAAATITLFTQHDRKLSAGLSVGAVVAGLLLSLALITLTGWAPAHEASVAWLTLGDLKVDFGLRFDPLSLLMMLVVTGVASAIHIYSWGYMSEDRSFPRYFACLSLFTFSMLGIVLANSFLELFIFWELVGVSSYLLIGFWFEKPAAADAGKKAFITNRLGDFGFLLGILTVWASFNSLKFDAIEKALIANPQALGALATTAGLLIFCGAMGKSAQFPLHVWLPDAMEGPTPVSALIHAATMVAAGVYLVGRVYPIFTPDAFLFIAYIGFITLFIAATIALTQNDIKKVLAYSTISQLGFMIMGLGVGGYTAGLAHLATHAAFKACLFLGSGSVIHAVHSQDIQEMGGLRKKMPITFFTFLIATLAIAGVPGFSGFFSKDMILAAALEFGMRNPQHYILFFGALFTAGMTAFYMFRLVIMAFFGEAKDHHKYDHAHESPPNMWVPLVVLAILSFSFWFKSPFVEKGWFQTLITKPATVANIAKAPAAFASMEHAAVMTGEATRAAAPAEGGDHGTVPAAHGEKTGAPAHAGAAELDAHIAHTAHASAMYSSVAIGALGIFLAFVVYSFGWIDPARVANSVKPLYNFLLNKWYFDELYDKTVIGGSISFSKFLAWFDLHVVDGLVNLTAQLGVFASFLVGKFDNYVVDGAVNGLASATIGGGSILRRLQTGKLYHYVFVLAGGALVIFLIKAF